MSGKKSRRAPSATPWDGLPDDQVTTAQGIVKTAYDGIYAFRHELNPLQPVNRMCFLLKCFLRAHSGFNRGDIQGYLDLFSVAMNEPKDKLEKAALVLDRAMLYPNTLRFRDFYNVKPRSGGMRREELTYSLQGRI